MNLALGSPDHRRRHRGRGDGDAARAPRARPRAATSPTVTARPACSASSRPASRCCSASSSSSPSRATTSRARAPRRRRSSSRSRSRRPSSSRQPCARSSRASSSATPVPSCRPRVGAHGAGTQGDAINPWGVELFQTLAGSRAGRRRASSRPTTSGSTRRPTREEARLDRIHGAVGVIPTPLWIVLFFISAVIFVFMLFFADRGERAVVQARAHGLGRCRDRGHAACCCASLDEPFQTGRRRPATGRDGAHAADRRRGARRHRRRRPDRRATPRGAPAETVDGLVGPKPTGSSSLATVLLALATVATAWSGYQASRWNGEQAKAFSRANAARIESTQGRATSRTPRRRSTSRRSRSGSTPTRSARSELADFYFKRFRAGVQAGRRRLDRDEAAPEPRRTADPVRDAAVQAGGAGGGRASRRRSRGPVGQGADERAAGDELRPRASCSSPPRCSSPA